jgi:hypothetical protein
MRAEATRESAEAVRKDAERLRQAAVEQAVVLEELRQTKRRMERGN